MAASGCEVGSCNFPLTGWLAPTGGRPRFRAPAIHVSQGFEEIKVPCGKCLGCRSARAAAWAYRCRLEWQEHGDSCWCTLTYSDQYKPVTISRRHLAAFLKRLRARRSETPIKFFGCGEYGERTKRPHYHVILFGLSRYDPAITEAWGMGHVRVDPLSPRAINYVAGYVAKKIGEQDFVSKERVDPETGECYTYQPPFLQMSRRPGIGAKAREHVRSWRDFAVVDGRKQAVPRYLHEAWVNSADDEAVKAHKEARKAQAVQLGAGGAAREALLENKFSRYKETRTL